MKIQNRSGADERLVLTGMIVDKHVLGRVTSRWKDDGLFASRWANIVGTWCVKYFRKHADAPNRKIEVLFNSWSDTADKETVSLVEKFLSQLAGQYVRQKKELNADFTLDLAAKLFNRVALNNLRDAIDGDLEIGKLDKAVGRVGKFQKIEVGSDAAVNILHDRLSVKLAMDDSQSEPMILYPGALGDFFGESLARENFVAVMGPEKRGKSWVLLDMAWRGMLQRRKVAYFEAGDLTKRQLLRRFYTRAVGRPLKPKSFKYPTELKIVEERHDGEEDDNSDFKVKHATKNYTSAVTERDIKQALKKIRTERVKSETDYLKLSVHPNSSITVGGIRSILSDWSSFEDWNPDVVIVDYADILAAPSGFNGESRDAINENWKALRRMSQELHCLVLVGTQANAASYTANTLGMQNFSEDKRKFSHVTGMLGLNQTDDEKLEGVQRWNWLVLREDEFHVSASVHVAQCLAIANPAVRSAS